MHAPCILIVRRCIANACSCSARMAFVCSIGVEMDRKQHDNGGTEVIVLMYAMQH